MEVHFFDSGLEKFISSLEKSTIAKVLCTIDLLEHFGNHLSFPHSKKVEEGLFELRIRGIQEVRIFYVFHQRKAVLLHGFLKQKQKTPRQELFNALKKVRELDRV